MAAALGLALAGCSTLGAGGPTPAGGGAAAAIAALDDAGLAGARWGLLAVTVEGEVVAEARADERFIPASNTKLFTTAAAFARLDDLEAATAAGDGTSVRLEARGDGGPPDVVLVGAGDLGLGAGPDCVDACLEALADAAAGAAPRVRDVVGDDRLYPDERWGPGWSWEDMQEGFGAAASALTVNDNVLVLEVAPGATAGAPATAAWRAGDDIAPLETRAVTAADGEPDLRIERRPGGEAVRLYGRLPLGAAPVRLRVGVDDPALAAAERFRRLLAARGVAVEGVARARHRPLALEDDPRARRGPAEAPAPEGVEVARLPRAPLEAGLTRIAKVSQNLLAELTLRRLGRLDGSGSRADGLAQVEATLTAAGVERRAFDLYDGSGMSAYNRVTPRATVRLLQWSTTQPWGAAWRATLPVGGRDGTLARRFAGTPLEGRIFAKTGSLNGVNALAGFLTAASGRTLIFAVYVNDRPSAAPAATAAMDRALLALAAAN